MALVRIEWHLSDEQCIVTECEAPDAHPDLLDELSRRAVWLLRETMSAVEPVEDEPAEG